MEATDDSDLLAPTTPLNGRLDLQRFRYEDPDRRQSPRLIIGAIKRQVASPTEKVSSGRVKKPTLANRKALTTSPSPSKSGRLPAGYVAPSRYAHLSPLVDIFEPNLILVFVGVNPGISTAVAGHAYAHPSNRFWHLLHRCGLTPERRLSPREDRDLPRLYEMGMTNIVSRPTKDQSQLSKEEMVAGTAILEEKFRQWKPEAVCLVGKGIWEAVWKYKHGRAMKKEEFRYGWQDESQNMGRGNASEIDAHGMVWNGSRVFVATSTSGQAASTKPAEKEAVWAPLGQWVQARRLARGKPCEHSSTKSADKVMATHY